jgi:hypothetical protein
VYFSLFSASGIGLSRGSYNALFATSALWDTLPNECQHVLVFQSDVVARHRMHGRIPLGGDDDALTESDSHRSTHTNHGFAEPSQLDGQSSDDMERASRLERYLVYDLVGAPWYRNNARHPFVWCGGNGGVSLRRRAAMRALGVRLECERWSCRQTGMPLGKNN